MGRSFNWQIIGRQEMGGKGRGNVYFKDVCEQIESCQITVDGKSVDPGGKEEGRERASTSERE